MRILASTTAGAGHFTPMASILRACTGAGHDVLVACPASFESVVTGHGFAVATFDDGPADQQSRHGSPAGGASR